MGMRGDPIPVDAAFITQRLRAVAPYEWVFQWAMFVLLVLGLGVALWIGLGSRQARAVRHALVPALAAVTGALSTIPAFIFRFSSNADGFVRRIQLVAEPSLTYYPDPIRFNYEWLIAGYGPRIAVFALFGGLLSIGAAVAYVLLVRSVPRG